MEENIDEYVEEHAADFQIEIIQYEKVDVMIQPVQTVSVIVSETAEVHTCDQDDNVEVMSDVQDTLRKLELDMNNMEENVTHMESEFLYVDLDFNGQAQGHELLRSDPVLQSIEDE